MLIYSPTEAARLLAEIREDDARATKAPWSPHVRYDAACKGWSAIGPYHEAAWSASKVKAQADSITIASLRNNARELADQLEAAIGEVDRLTKERNAAHTGIAKQSDVTISSESAKKPLHEVARLDPHQILSVVGDEIERLRGLGIQLFADALYDALCASGLISRSGDALDRMLSDVNEADRIRKRLVAYAAESRLSGEISPTVGDAIVALVWALDENLVRTALARRKRACKVVPHAE